MCPHAMPLQQVQVSLVVDGLQVLGLDVAVRPGVAAVEIDFATGDCMLSYFGEKV